MKNVGYWIEKIQGFDRTPKPDLTEWRPKPPSPPPKRIINENIRLDTDWYLFGCFWCVFCLGVALGGYIVQ